MELVSCYLSGAQNFEMASRFLENFCSPGITHHKILRGKTIRLEHILGAAVSVLSFILVQGLYLRQLAFFFSLLNNEHDVLKLSVLCILS